MSDKFKILNAPQQVKQAALLLILYALWVLLSAIYFAYENNAFETKELFRAVLRFVGVSYIGWWLLSLKKYSWWFAIVTSAFLSLMGLTAISISIFSESYQMIYSLIPPLYFLLHAFIILINKKTRGLFLDSNA